MPPPKIVHLTTVHRPFDVRIFHKECRSLAQAGYEVVLIAPHERPEAVNGIRIHAIPKPANRRERVQKTMWQAYRAAIAENGDLYHFHDPELIPVGVLLKARGKKVIYDIHEDVPAQILGKSYIRFRWLRRLLSQMANLVEKTAALSFDGLVIANPLRVKRFPARKSIVIANLPVLDWIDKTPPVETAPSPPPALIYEGGLMRIRGICELLEVMPRLQHQAHLWLVGPWESEEFRKTCESMPWWKHVHYLGYVHPEQVYAHLKRADVGLVTIYPQENYLHNLPVKAFEYMACSLPMVMSDFPYWREVFEDAALFVDPEDPDAIADAVRFLLDHPAEARQMGDAGRKLVEEKYSWETESRKLLAFYDKILHN